MEAPNLLENGNIPQKRKLPCCQVAFYTLIFVLIIIISALVSVVFCLIHHKQFSGGSKCYFGMLVYTSCCDVAPSSTCSQEEEDKALGSCWAHGSLKKPPTPNLKDVMSWEWNLERCNGFVQKDDEEYLLIEQSGNYFIYAQINRKQHLEKSFTLMMYKEPDILLNKVVGPKGGDERGTVNFGRPFFLQKGDKLYCQGNFNLNHILEGNQTYWGLYKI